jgi:hypothetical protein
MKMVLSHGLSHHKTRHTGYITHTKKDLREENSSTIRYAVRA